VRGRNNHDYTRGFFNLRWIPEKGEAGRVYASLRASIHQNITMGGDYRPLTDDLGFLATWRARAETEKYPALVISTSHDDFVHHGEEVDSQSVSATLSKFVYALGSIEASPYVGGAWIFELDEVRLIGGVNVRQGDWSAMIQYSGTNTHLTVGRDYERIRLSYVYWGMEYHGVAGTLRF
jgi:hypothetical protein